MKTATAPVRLKSFGQGEFETRTNGSELTVKDVFAEHHVNVDGRRVSLNGHTVGLDTPVKEGDQLTATPWIEGG